MERRVARLAGVVALLVVSVTAAVAVQAQDDDGNGWGHRDGRMAAHGYDRNGVPGDRWQPGSHGPPRMMAGPMHGVRVGSEYDYLAEMVAHHEEAVAAAQQLRRSQRPEMRELGAAVVASQSAQIEQMRRWLADWYPHRSGQVAYRPMMRDLTGLSGDRLDEAFLQDMLGHHMGAVMMSQQLLVRGLARHEQVEVLARTVRDEQHAEILQMRRWLQDWFGGPGA